MYIPRFYQQYRTGVPYFPREYAIPKPIRIFLFIDLEVKKYKKGWTLQSQISIECDEGD